MLMSAYAECISVLDIAVVRGIVHLSCGERTGSVCNLLGNPGGSSNMASPKHTFFARGGGGGGAVREVPPSRGLLFRESSARPVLCKPKLLPLQSISLEKLERLQAQQKPPPKNC